MGRTPRVTRDQVLGAAREAFVERGYEGATLADIGSRLEVSPAAVLRHAPTKRALFLAAMGQAQPEMLPLEFLQSMTGAEDPRPVLRRVGETLIPFLEARIREVVARWVYFKTVSGIGKMPLPFDPTQRPTPPQKNLKFLEDYLRRAGRHGKVRIRDYRAAALAFLATLHSYVFLQHVMDVLEEPMPLAEYLDTVLEIWTRGAIVSRGRVDES